MTVPSIVSLYRGTGDESLDQKPAPLPPAVQTGTTLPQMIPKPQASEEDLAHTAPARIPSPRDAYDNVNLKNSILPPELRTEENLEGRPLDLAQVRQLEEAERRQEQSYEEIEMSLKRKEEAVATVRQMADMSGKKGEESDDEVYTNPVDAVAEEAVKAAAKTGSLKKKKKQKEGKKSETESVSPVAHEPGLYTSVFDQLPSGEKEVVAKQSKTGGRGNSKSPTPPTNKKTFEGGGGGRRDFCGYEDMEDEMFATSAPCKESPLLTGAGELDDPMTSPQDENEKMKLTKRYSHPAAPRRDREAMKEMVEINPRSKKPVTLSSGRRKDRLQRGSGEGVDGEREGVDGEEEEVVVNGDTKSRSAGSSPNTKAKEFNIADKGDVPQDSYAMVDLAGKMRYRAESDSMKREGSGVPKRYTVKERPPEPEESTAVTVNP